MYKKLLALSLALCLTALLPAEPLMASGADGSRTVQTEAITEAKSKTLSMTETEFTSETIESETLDSASTEVPSESSEFETDITEDTSALQTEVQTEQTKDTFSTDESETIITDSTQSESKKEPKTPSKKKIKVLENKTESETEIPDLDYILGRPMTDEEIANLKGLSIPTGSLESSELPTLASGGISRSRATFPSSYDARNYGYVTSVKNQGDWNTCWAFAPLAAGESSLLRNGLANASIDLSEQHLAYFFYFTQVDPLGLTANDRTIPISMYMQGGGNNIFTIFSLAKWIGVADESIAPYVPSSDKNPDPLKSELAYKDIAHLQNAYIVPSSSLQDIKTLIMDNGAAAVNLYMDGADYLSYYNPNTAAYCYTSNGYVQPQNHTVTIIGWNDKYKKENFLYGKRPKQNGAWLVKNSWGSTWGDNGYFWLSYEDAFLQSNATNSDAAAFAFDFESADNYDHNYQYDGTSNAQLATFSNNGVFFSNVYQAKGNKSGADELLEAISFAHYTPGVTYEIQVYKNLKNPSDPSSGTPMMKYWQCGSSQYAGYQTIQLDKPVTLSKSDTFSVVIHLKAPSGQDLSVFTDNTFTKNNWIQFVARTNKNQSFFKLDNEDKWADASSMQINGVTKPSTIRIKAFTSDLSTTSISKMSLKASSTSPAIGKTTTLTAGISPKNGTYRSISWKSSDTKIVNIKSSKNNQAVITGTGYGTATITARTNTGAKATIKITVAAPAFTTLSSRGYRSLDLSWTKVPGAKGYVLYRCTSKNGSYKEIANISSGSVTRYTDKLLSTGKTYYYRLRSYRKSGKKLVYSSYSGKRSCMPVPNPAKLKTIKKSGTNKLVLTWNSSPGASGYEIYRSTSANGTYKRLKTLNGKNTTSYTTSYSKKTAYFYKIRSYSLVNSKKVYSGYSDVRRYS